MKGFGRHTSKVIAYLRDQVGPCRAGPLIPRYRIGAVAWGQSRKERKRGPCLSRSN